ncbi:MAG: RHS repeat domain-containing protein, partial [Mariniphaga sp.]
TRFTVTAMNARQQITAATYGSSLGFPPSGEREGGFWIGGDAYSAPAVAVKQGGNTTWYYLLRDYLGNITHVVNTSNTVTAEYSYDAWGRRRDKDDWSYTLSGEPELLAGRSFTSHEYLPEFNLINMNGRLYDPLPGRFLSLDNYVQMPDNTQNFNRYSYCLNNPLVYTDPDGEIIFTLLAALIPGAQPLLPLAIAADIGGIINTANNWEHVNNAYDNNFFSGIGKMFGYYGVGAGKAAATYYGGPLGTVASSYGGDALNSLLVDGTLNNFHPDVTTQNLFVDIAVSQLGIGNSLGDAVSKNIGNELLKNTTKQLISQNVDGLISNIGVRTWQTGSIKDGLGSGWQDYTKGGGWWKYSLSSLGQGIMDTYDSQTIARNKTREAMKDYYKGNKSFSGFNYPNQPGTWMESLYYSQMKANTTLNLRLYSPTRNFFSTTLPRWYYPELYNY